MNMKVIENEEKLCICCMEKHNVKKVRTIETMTFKDVEVKYEAKYFYCDLAEELYMDEDMIRENDINIKDAYRKKMGLMASDEIKSLRYKYEISQNDLCILLGWGGKTITRYESHQVQDKAHDSILKKLDKDPEWFLFLLEESKPALNIEAYKRYYNIGRILYEKSQNEYLKKSIEAKYIRFADDELYNGNAKLDLDKVVDVIRYFSNAPDVISLYKVKLMKLLWYADALSYKQRERAITGLVYQAMPMGAVPIGHDIMITLKGVNCEEIDMGTGTAYRFLSSSDDRYEHLSEDDIEILNKVILKLGKMSKDDIVSFMHQEQAYTDTSLKELISYEYAKNLQI